MYSGGRALAKWFYLPRYLLCVQKPTTKKLWRLTKRLTEQAECVIIDVFCPHYDNTL